MTKLIFRSALLCLLLAAGWLTGCKRSDSLAANYFPTHFQDESQFIVEAIASDLAEQMYYARFHEPPPAKIFSVTATETPASRFRAPVYELCFNLDNKLRNLKTTLPVNGPIWSPEVYDPVAGLLASHLKLAAAGNTDSGDTALLEKLTDATAATLEKENQTLSPALQNGFSDPALHQQAAVLLGAFALREHSGVFYEIRLPLCRMTAHLTMARYLGGDYDLNGKVATVMLLTLMNDQSAALDSLKEIKSDRPGVNRWVRALQARNNNDYRPLKKLRETTALSPMEGIELFRAMDLSIGPDAAWGALSDAQKKTPDYHRIAEESWFSVGVGNELSELAVPQEFGELAVVYQLTHGKTLPPEEMVAALNELPEPGCFTGSGQSSQVRIIGWGQWADFFQRHLSNTLRSQYVHLASMLGLPEDARAFAAKCDQMLGGLRLAPFLRRFMAENADACHKAMDEGIKVTIATPQWVPSECWCSVTYALTQNDSYEANSNPHVNEWFKHNPPPGTAYDIRPRLDMPSLVDRPDGPQLLDELHDTAPCNWDLLSYLIKTKYHDAPNSQQASELFGSQSLYAVGAMELLASAVKDQPRLYEQALLRMVDLNPATYLRLASFYRDSHQDPQAVDCYEKSIRLNPDSVSVAYQIGWLMHYYLNTNRVADARRVADYAGEVYSDSGLATKAEFFEATGNDAEAFAWYSKIVERYDDYSPVMAFGERYQVRTGDASYLKKQEGKIFPRGAQSVRLSDFTSPPTDGVMLNGDSDLMQQVGLKSGDVIVAISGVRTHNSDQYTYERGLLASPQMDLIVWQGGAYHEIKSSPPDHRFGVDLANYSKH